MDTLCLGTSQQLDYLDTAAPRFWLHGLFADGIASEGTSTTLSGAGVFAGTGPTINSTVRHSQSCVHARDGW